MRLCDEIEEYLEIVEAHGAIVCPEQKALAKLVRRAFEQEDIYVDTEQLARYMSYQRYFPFELYPWEKFIFTLHDCTYRRDCGLPRWPALKSVIGRGAGKNGYMAFEAFCLSSEANGIPDYNIEIYATAEKQAKRSFMDVHRVCERNRKLSKFYDRNLEVIRNYKTNSTITFNTSRPDSKDGGRPGIVMFDEYHKYDNRELINVAIGGLGKTKHPRETWMSSNGYTRGAVFDSTLEDLEAILSGEMPDNGTLPFICRLSDEKEIHDPKNWEKANPTLHYAGKSDYADTLFAEMMREYNEYKCDPIAGRDFAVKRCGITMGNIETEVTSWENNTACSRSIGDITGKYCVMGIDYASTQDFLSAGYMFLVNSEIRWLTHTWVCKHSQDLPRIKYPLEDAALRGELTIVDDIEIHPELPAAWLLEVREKYRLNVLGGAIDHFRHTLLAKALKEIGYIPEHREGGEIVGNLKLIRPSDIAQIAPALCLEFGRKSIAWGEDNHTMQWFTNNVKKVTDSRGNIGFEKIEPKSRKTDGFMALAAARTQLYRLEPYDRSSSLTPASFGVWTY